MYKFQVIFHCEDCHTKHNKPIISEEEPQFSEPYKNYKCDYCNGKLLVTEVLSKKYM